MTRPLTDWTGLTPIKPHSHVKITRSNHRHYGRTGTVVRIRAADCRVWVALAGGVVTSALCRSLTVL